MRLDVHQSFRGGFTTLLTGTGASLVGVFAAYRLINEYFLTNAFLGLKRSVNDAGATEPGLVQIPFASLWLLSLASLLLGAALTVVALRVLTAHRSSEHTREDHVRKILGPTMNMFAAGVTASVVLGFVAILLVASPWTGLLLVPAIVFLTVNLVFTPYIIALNDENFISAFSGSWTLVRGSRTRILLLLIGVAVVTAAFYTLGWLGTRLSGGAHFPRRVLGSSVEGLVSVYWFCVFADAYVQVADEPGL